MVALVLFGGKGMGVEVQMGQSLLQVWIPLSQPLLLSFHITPACSLPNNQGCHMVGLPSNYSNYYLTY